MIFTSKNFKFIKAVSMLNDTTDSNFYLPFVSFGYNPSYTSNYIKNTFGSINTDIESLITMDNTTSDYFPPSEIEVVVIDKKQEIITNDTQEVRNIKYTPIVDVKDFNDDLISTSIFSDTRYDFALKIKYNINKTNIQLSQINTIKLTSFLQLTNKDSIIEKSSLTLKTIPLMLDVKSTPFTVDSTAEALMVEYLLTF